MGLGLLRLPAAESRLKPARPALPDSQVAEVTRQVEERLQALSGGAAAAARAPEYDRLLRASVPEWAYHRVSDEVLAIRDALNREGGQPLLAAFHRLVLMRMVPETRRLLQSKQYLAPALEWFDDAMTMIIPELPGRNDAELDFHDDGFAKDLSLAAFRTWALGAQLVEPRYPLPKRWMFESLPRSLFEGLGIMAKIGGREPLYSIHTYNRHLTEFTDPGWEIHYRRIASIMEHEPKVLGVTGASWFFDPAIETVSPRLAYLRKLPISNGAIFVKVRNTQHTYDNALSKSATRKQLFDEGKYQPQEWLMVWPRRELLHWAQTTKS